MVFLRRFILAVAIAAIALPESAPGETKGFKFESTILYQPDEVLHARVGADELTAHIKRIEEACAAYFASEKAPERLDIVVGVKSKGRVRVWFVSSRRTAAEQTLIVLKRKLETLPACSVENGPIAFAMRCTIGGASATLGNKDDQLPMPTEWRKAMEGQDLSVPDGLFSLIWRN
jgi:hypothetical protein